MFALKISTILKQFTIVVVANLTFLQFSLSISWLSPVLVKISEGNQTILYETLTEYEVSWLVSASILSGVIVMPFAGTLAHYLGRKRTLVIMTVPRLVACVLLLFTKHSWMLLLARCSTGLSDIIHISVTTTYSSEIASKEIRGALGTVSQIQSSLGGMLMLAIGPYVSFTFLNVIYACLIFGTTIPMLFLPETPYFMYLKGRTDKSIEVLTSLRGSETLAREEILEYSSTKRTKIVTKELFTDNIVLKTIGKVIVLGVCAQLVGYNSVSYYLQTVFDSTHTNISSELSSLIIGCIQMLACFCTILLTDTLGRKPVLTVTLAGLFLGMIGLGTFFKLTENGEEISALLNYIPLISIALVVFCYNAGLGSILWMLVAELFDGKFRSVGLSVGVFVSSSFAFLSTKYFPDVVRAVGPSATYYFFSAACVFTGIFITFFINETKGKAFSQIQKEMGRYTDDFVEEN